LHESYFSNIIFDLFLKFLLRLPKILHKLEFEHLIFYSSNNSIISYCLRHLFLNIAQLVGHPHLTINDLTCYIYSQSIDSMTIHVSIVLIEGTHCNPWHHLRWFWFHRKRCWVLCFMWTSTCPPIVILTIFIITNWYCVHHKCGPHFDWCCHSWSHSNGFNF